MRYCTKKEKWRACAWVRAMRCFAVGWSMKGEEDKMRPYFSGGGWCTGPLLAAAVARLIVETHCGSKNKQSKNQNMHVAKKWHQSANGVCPREQPNVALFWISDHSLKVYWVKAVLWPTNAGGLWSKLHREQLVLYGRPTETPRRGSFLSKSCPCYMETVWRWHTLSSDLGPFRNICQLNILHALFNQINMLCDIISFQFWFGWLFGLL